MDTSHSTMGETPRIELYMYCLTQEFPYGEGPETYLKNNEYIKAWSNNWENWPVWHTNTNNADKGEEEKKSDDDVKQARSGARTPARLLIRREHFGGIAYDPLYDRVFKVNHAGRELLHRYARQASGRQLNFHDEERSCEAGVPEFIHFLKRADLWEH